VAAELFVDTSAWYALSVPSVPQHRRVSDALRTRVKRGVRVVTTNLILAETHALLLRRTNRKIALAFVREVTRTPNIVVTSSPDLEEEAVSWLERFDDQAFSLTDAVSFAVMSDRRINEALALDHHFSVAGFVLIPGSGR
jgi:predicted nucleic acid-binding protein